MRNTSLWLIAYAALLVLMVMGTSCRRRPVLNSCADLGTVAYVAIDDHFPAFTFFLTLRPGEGTKQIEAAKAKGVVVFPWTEFKKDAKTRFMARVTLDQYHLRSHLDDLCRLFQTYTTAPWAITWNGGLAVTAKDFRAAERLYDAYQKNPAEYERLRPKPPAFDPNDPSQYLAPAPARNPGTKPMDGGK